MFRLVLRCFVYRLYREPFDDVGVLPWGRPSRYLELHVRVLTAWSSWGWSHRFVAYQYSGGIRHLRKVWSCLYGWLWSHLKHSRVAAFFGSRLRQLCRCGAPVSASWFCQLEYFELAALEMGQSLVFGASGTSFHSRARNGAVAETRVGVWWRFLDGN